MNAINARELMEMRLARPIKFRGKKFLGTNHDWWYGNLVRGNRNDIPIYIMGGFVKTEEGQMEPQFLTQVFPETVGQYIEIKDKNNNEIYEGDIVLCQYEEDYEIFQVLGFVEYNANNCEYFLQIKLDDGRPFRNRYIPMAVCCDVEVLGNIHDNPELLEVD